MSLAEFQEQDTPPRSQNAFAADRCRGPVLISRSSIATEAANPQLHPTVHFGRPGELVVDAEDRPLMPPQRPCGGFRSFDELFRWAIATFNFQPEMSATGRLIGATGIVTQRGQPVSITSEGDFGFVPDYVDFVATGGTGVLQVGSDTFELFTPASPSQSDLRSLVGALPVDLGVFAMERSADLPEESPDEIDEDVKLGTVQQGLEGPLPKERIPAVDGPFELIGKSVKDTGVRLKVGGWTKVKSRDRKIAKGKDFVVGVSTTIWVRASIGGGAAAIPLQFPGPGSLKQSKRKVEILKTSFARLDDPLKDTRLVQSHHHMVRGPALFARPFFETERGSLAGLNPVQQPVP